MTQVGYQKSLKCILSDLGKFAKYLLWSLRPVCAASSVRLAVISFTLLTRTCKTTGQPRGLESPIIGDYIQAPVEFKSTII